MVAGVPLTSGDFVLHRCDNPPCINSEHLFVGTHSDNMADMKAKGRAKGRKGTNHHNVKLTNAQVTEILAKYSDRSVSTAKIAKLYGVSQPTISYILIGKTWQHIPRNF